MKISDSLNDIDMCDEVINRLSTIIKYNAGNIPLLIQYARALELCNHNKEALDESLRLLRLKKISSTEKMYLYLLNARIYEKAKDKKQTKKSLDRCRSLFTSSTPSEILQLWNIRMASFHRVMTKDYELAKKYVANAKKHKGGEPASVFFLSAFLNDKLDVEVFYLKKAIRYFDSTRNVNAEGASYINLAETFKVHKHYKNYKENLFIAKKILEKEALPTSKTFLYENMMTYYRDNRNFEMALLYSDSLSGINQKIDSLLNLRTIAIVERKYDFEEAHHKAERLNKQLKEKKEKNNILIFTLLAFVLLILASIRFSYILSKKKRLLANKTNLLNKHNLELKDAMSSNKILMKENNHRVKNNLAILISIIDIEISKATSEYAKEKLNEISGRVYSIASIHKHIYNLENYSKVNTKTIFVELIAEQKNSMASQFSNNIEFNINSVELSVRKIIPLVLIVNELLTNAIKYALKDTYDFLTINLDISNDLLTLTTVDSGESYDFQNIVKENKSVGLQLVWILSQQLKGNLIYTNNPNTIKLVFPI